MGNVRRVYVEKKKDYAVKAKELLEELRQYLGLSIDEGANGFYFWLCCF